MTIGLVGQAGRAPGEFEGIRSVLLGVAHRIVGRAADAEDVVQDVWFRWQAADQACVRSPVAFLVTATRRLALNSATSAYARREVSAGEWLPELGPAGDNPAREVERAEALEAAVELLLERLAPLECAVFLLREAFGYSFREIAGMLGLSEANARQCGCRARQRMRQGTRVRVDPAVRDRLLAAFRYAGRTGDPGRLVALLAAPSRSEAPAHAAA